MRLLVSLRNRKSALPLFLAVLMLGPVQIELGRPSIQLNSAYADDSRVVNRKIDSNATNTQNEQTSNNPDLEAAFQEVENPDTVEIQPNDGLSELNSLTPISKEREAELLGNWGDQ